MNTKRKKLTIAALAVFALTVLFAHWDLTGSPDHFNFTVCGPMFAPPDLGPWPHRELATSNFWTWLAIGVIYAGLFMVCSESNARPAREPRDSGIDA